MQNTSRLIIRSLVGLLLVGTAFGPQVLQAQIPQQIIATTDAEEPTAVDTADIDGDGDKDILVASRKDNKISWYENQVGETGADADGFGLQKVISTSVSDTRSVTAADVDGDGNMDVLAASTGDAEVVWFENQIGESGADSDGFGPQQVITTNASGAWSIKTADLDGDGDMDVFSASWFDNKIAWYENEVGESGADSDGFGAQQVITTSVSAPRSVAAADVDGDGDEDIFSASAGDDKVAWYENQIGESGADSDGFGAQQVITTNASSARSVAAGDFDGDGDPDVVSASYRDNKIAWYENEVGESGADSDGFGDQQVITTSVSGARAVAAADINGDGDMDVLSGSQSDDKIAWYESEVGESGADSDGFGDQQVITTNASGAQSVAAGDIDEDGRPDVLSASYRDNKVAWYKNEVLQIGSDSDGFGRQQTVTSSPDGVRSVVTADVDGDGDMDIISALSDDDKIAWYENQIGEGGEDSDGFGSQQVITVNAANAQSVAVADLDGDGDPDVLSASSNDDKIAWYENEVGESSADRDGFGPQQVITNQAINTRSVAAADLNGDGDPDVLSTASFENRIAWYENQIGEGGTDSDGFGDQKVITTNASSVESVAAADIDGDEDMDVLSASSDDNKIAWYENEVGESGADSDGFGAQLVITTSTSDPGSVAAADIDGDGDQDVFSASLFDDKIAWYENEVGTDGADSDGFGDQQVITTQADFARSVSAADVNGDGDADVLAGFNDTVAWYENQIGEGGADSDGFGAQQTITNTADGVEFVTAADLDRDGDQDVLSASARSSDNKIAWYENTEGVLPVEMATFEARVDGRSVRLVWQTASETNNAGFRVQRRVDGGGGPGEQRTWKKVGFVESKAEGGTTTEPLRYRFTDDALPYEAEAVIYRLKQVDTDGRTNVSETVTVERGLREVQLLGTTPNPASRQVTLRYALPERQEVTLRLYDVLGREVRTIVSSEQEGRHKRTLDVSGLSSGTYFLRLKIGNQVRTQKLTVVR